MDTTAMSANRKRVINSISGRLSLRAPQRESLEALAKAIDATDDRLLDPKHDVPALLETLKAEFPTLEDFERDFPSLCLDRKSTRLNSSHVAISYAVFCLK